MMKYFNEPFHTTEQPVEADRYMLVRAEPCPYAHRPAIARELLGLEEAIDLVTVNPVNTEKGWSFAYGNQEQAPLFDAIYVPDLYKTLHPDYEGSYSVPFLADKINKKIVRKESLDILRDLTTAFSSLHKEGALDLYPEALQKEIDHWNDVVNDRLLSDIYRMGRTKDQATYDQAFERYFDFLEELEERFSENRYFFGNLLTETDIVIFTALVRLDIAYYSVFSANKHRLTDYPHLSGYMVELFQIPAFRNTTHFEAIKKGYYTGTSGAHVYHRSIVPKGPDTSHWYLAHNRNHL